MGDESKDDGLGDRVVFFPSVGSEQREEILFRVQGLHKQCKHKLKNVNVEQRVVECKTCGAFLDPFDVVVEFARHWEYYEQHLAWFKAQRTRHGEEIAELKRQVRNLKAQKRRTERS